MGELEGYKEVYIFTYSTEHLEKKDKIRFYYGLKGRDGKSGAAAKYDIIRLGRAVLMVDAKFKTEVDEFLKYWNCNYKKRRMYIET